MTDKNDVRSSPKLGKHFLASYFVSFVWVYICYKIQIQNQEQVIASALGGSLVPLLAAFIGSKMANTPKGKVAAIWIGSALIWFSTGYAQFKNAGYIT